MRHGLTLGELAKWFVRKLRLDVECEVVTMEGWNPAGAPGYGWPLGERDVGQSEPQCAQSVDGALLRRNRDAGRHHAVGRPRHDAAARALRRARSSSRVRCSRRWSRSRRDGCAAAGCGRAGSSRPSTSTSASSARACRSTSTTRPTITTHFARGGWSRSRSRRCARCGPTTSCGATFRTSTKRGRLAIDLINGSELLRGWVDDPAATAADLDALALPDEDAWREERRTVLLYR